MRRKTTILLIMVVFLLPGFAGAVSEKDFEAQTTESMVNLCTASQDDPLYHQAINFCHGYLVGAFHYYEATSSGPAGLKLVCTPDPRPSRNATIDMFIEHWTFPANQQCCHLKYMSGKKKSFNP